MSYADLAALYKDQPRTEVFAHFGYAGNRGETWETPYEKLAKLAKPEEWDFRRPEFKRDGQRFPVLKGYLNYTFRRLQDQDKIVYSGSDDRACFNTGLQTSLEKDIYATFFRNRNAQTRGQPDWTLYGFFDSYDRALTDFRPLPDIATYIDNASDLVFDTKYRVEVNYEHLFNDSRDRLPDVLQDEPTLAISAFEGALQLLKERVRRNYKLAIPNWYHGQIQLLLPLNLMSEHEADLALAAEKDQSAHLYRIKTVLTMDMAYMNARLITRPDRDWLNPIAGLGDAMQPFLLEEPFATAVDLWERLSPIKCAVDYLSKIIYWGQADADWRLIPSVHHGESSAR